MRMISLLIWMLFRSAPRNDQLSKESLLSPSFLTRMYSRFKSPRPKMFWMLMMLPSGKSVFDGTDVFWFVSGVESSLNGLIWVLCAWACSEMRLCWMCSQINKTATTVSAETAIFKSIKGSVFFNDFILFLRLMIAQKYGDFDGVNENLLFYCSFAWLWFIDPGIG